MQTVALEKAQATFADLVKQVADGEEFTITQNGQPKAKLSAVAPRTGRHRRTPEVCREKSGFRPTLTHR
jgi:prevent-host-death family protein